LPPDNWFSLSVESWVRTCLNADYWTRREKLWNKHPPYKRVPLYYYLVTFVQTYLKQITGKSKSYATSETNKISHINYYFTALPHYFLVYPLMDYITTLPHLTLRTERSCLQVVELKVRKHTKAWLSVLQQFRSCIFA